MSYDYHDGSRGDVCGDGSRDDVYHDGVCHGDVCGDGSHDDVCHDGSHGDGSHDGVCHGDGSHDSTHKHNRNNSLNQHIFCIYNDDYLFYHSRNIFYENPYIIIYCIKKFSKKIILYKIAN